ncbi:MAG: cobyric acid synthase [Deferribacterales bacterium]
MKKAKSIMFQGTGSGVGKSVICAGFCRLLARRGVRVAPFKSQNMALNSGVAAGGEMGRAQILQAEAAGIEPDVRMNPILLKPQGNAVSQLIRMGKPVGTYSAREYYTLHETNLETAIEAYESLAKEYDVIVIEGAGSPAEINLQRTDIVNMRTADFAEAPVYIIGDIDRGGVFAWMKGTYDLLPRGSRHRVKGFIINRFRGDISLLEPGIDMFEEMVKVKIAGTVPMLNLTLEEEDSQNIKNSAKGGFVTVAVVKLARMSNFSDFAPLAASPDINLIYAKSPNELTGADIIIIPGSKSTVSDMIDLRMRGFDKKIKQMSGATPIIGICGGFQMLGKTINDPEGIEGEVKETEGLGLLNMSTVITPEKTLLNREYTGQSILKDIKFRGYEIHMGISETSSAYEQLVSEKDICIADTKNKVVGTYIHGLFDSENVMSALTALSGKNISPDYSYYNNKMSQLDLLADTLEQCLDIEHILSDLH